MTKDLADIKRFHARISQTCGMYGGETQQTGVLTLSREAENLIVSD